MIMMIVTMKQGLRISVKSKHHVRAVGWEGGLGAFAPPPPPRWDIEGPPGRPQGHGSHRLVKGYSVAAAPYFRQIL